MLVCMVATLTISQAQTTNEAFEQERQRMLNDFGSFRKKVLDDYASYLDGVWQRFDAFRGVERDPKPKPTVVPKAEGDAPEPVAIPVPDAPEEPVMPEEPKPVVPPKPEPLKPMAPTAENITFAFYGMAWKAPKVDVETIRFGDNKSYGNAWRGYESKGTRNVAAYLRNIAQAQGLNDWFAFQMVRQYADAAGRYAGSHARMALQHFLMVNMGYDVRLAHTKSQTILLVPFCQMVYGRIFLKIREQKFYVFYDDINGERQPEAVYTCELPEDAYCGNVMNLEYNNSARISSGEQKHRMLTDGKITLEANVDKALMEMLRHYPQMDVPVYAKSAVLPKLREDLLRQLRPQIEGLSETEAANKLIHFVQYAFDYATDGNQHGYEKAYFLEENFYYPKNDCEDRAIFYAYLIRNLLGLDVHLVHFPGHECTAVNFRTDAVRGDYYTYEGKKFFICDPTYIGAKIGECMSDYRNTKPKIELWY